MNDIRLCLLINTLSGGGSEKQLLLTAIGLQKHGYRCSIYWLEDRPLHRQWLSLIQTAKRVGVQFRAPSHGARIDFLQLARLRTELVDNRNTVLWTWGYRSDFVALGILLTTFNTKIIGSLRSAAAQKIWKFRWFWKLLSHTHCAFISNSRLNVQQVARVAPLILKKTKVVYNAVEDRYFEATRVAKGRPAELRVVMLGNQTSHIKGYDIALQVAALIKSNNLKIKIIIGGSPVDETALRKSIQVQKLTEVITLYGSVVDVSAFLETGDVFMLLSRYEGMPNALIEAMSLGVPAVATRVGDLSEIVRDGVHLRLVDTEANDAFRVLLELWREWPETQQMAAAGRAFCREQFQQSSLIDSTASYLQELCVATMCSRSLP